MRSSAFTGLALVLLAACGAGGCSRAHLTNTHGRAYHEVFAAQDANPNRSKTPPRSVHGLDSQEAAIIAGSYRKALAPKSDSSGQGNQLLMVAPPRAGNESASLPASVPSGQ